LKYFIVPADLDSSEHVSKLPCPDNFLSFWSFEKAEKVKKELEQAYKYGYKFRACEQYFKE